jgi:hypothetical protein
MEKEKNQSMRIIIAIALFIVILVSGTLLYLTNRTPAQTTNPVTTTQVEEKNKATIEIIDEASVSKKFTAEFSDGKTAFEVLQDLDMKDVNFSFEYKDWGGSLGAAPTAFNGIQIDSTKQWWEFTVNGAFSDLGISSYKPKNNDLLTFKVSNF